MKLFLSKQCESLTGSLGHGFGYYIQARRTKSGNVVFFSQRSSKGNIPHDGHWRFIVACAELAKSKLHISDIHIDWSELVGALNEAGYFVAARKVRENADKFVKTDYNAQDIINLKFTFSL